MNKEYTFLIIEDNSIDQIITNKLLRNEIGTQTEIHTVNNGEEGLQWIKKYNNTNTLIILLDIKMPIMNGFEFLSEYKKILENTLIKTKLYMLSSTLDKNEIDLIKNNPLVHNFFSKPFPVKDFLNQFE